MMQRTCRNCTHQLEVPIRVDGHWRQKLICPSCETENLLELPPNIDRIRNELDFKMVDMNFKRLLMKVGGICPSCKSPFEKVLETDQALAIFDGSVRTEAKCPCCKQRIILPWVAKAEGWEMDPVQTFESTKSSEDAEEPTINDGWTMKSERDWSGTSVHAERQCPNCARTMTSKHHMDTRHWHARCPGCNLQLRLPFEIIEKMDRRERHANAGRPIRI